ncbi:Retrovirus-related Pol polyprotein from transposon 297 [Eumeta japonica]|uniref:Retrovirus-related Pol polyprotein from transposon 297 n=1 Tax=Eumeta variegata TaxID=151549 RepID=A0A4C1TI27_EUMVA|nr:Retrovirus-related Pol polyprotein from transposon 297 [Eumeta japonica]
MNPETYKAHFNEYNPIQPEKFEVKTAHALSQHKGSIITPAWNRIFKKQIEQPHKFYLFHFSDKYNVLFGLDILQQADEVKKAFQRSKNLITKASVLTYPDYNSTFTLTTDASDKALSAVLSQNQHPIAYASRTLKDECESDEEEYTDSAELLTVLQDLNTDSLNVTPTTSYDNEPLSTFTTPQETSTVEENIVYEESSPELNFETDASDDDEPEWLKARG